MEQIQFIYFQDYMQYYTVHHKENCTYMEIWHRRWWFKLRPQLPVPRPQLPVPRPQLPVPRPQLPVPRPQLPMPRPQLPVPRPQLPVPRPQLPVPRPQLPVCFGFTIVNPTVPPVPSTSSYRASPCRPPCRGGGGRGGRGAGGGDGDAASLASCTWQRHRSRSSQNRLAAPPE